MLQSTDPERLSHKECSSVDPWSSLGMGNRIDIVDGLETDETGNNRDLVGERMEGKDTGRDY